jgi:Outer membrane protein beta-barrel domain
MTPASRKWTQILLSAMLVLFPFSCVQAQDYSHLNFNIGGGIGFPVGNLSNFVNSGGNFVVGGGVNFSHHLGVDGEFMWHDLPIKSSFINALNTPSASARQYSVTINPIISVGGSHRGGAYVIGGIGWYHRSGETTTPVLATICDPYLSWWFGCSIGTVSVITGSASDDTWGQNIGGGVTARLGESHVKFYAEARYHHADYHSVSTELVPLTFGLRW